VNPAISVFNLTGARLASAFFTPLTPAPTLGIGYISGEARCISNKPTVHWSRDERRDGMANDSLRNRAQASDKCLILYYACSAPMFTTHNPKVKVKHGRPISNPSLESGLCRPRGSGLYFGLCLH